MQFVMLKRDGLDDYHQRRANKHGYLYNVVREGHFKVFRECRSIATGVICTLFDKYLEFSDAVQESEGPEVQERSQVRG
jgi:hypothetical protein